MTSSKINPFPNPGSCQVPEQLLALNKPAHEAIADFIHGCSPDSATRTVAATALVLSLWQLKGHALTPEVPSLLLLHAGEAADDPIDKLVRDLVYDEQKNKPRVQTKGPFIHAPIDLAPMAMRNAFLIRHKLGRDIPGRWFQQILRGQECGGEIPRSSRVTAFGSGRCRPYAEAWHPEYGLHTEEDDQIILRLNDEKDRTAFYNDVINEPRKLVFAEGIGATCSWCRRVSRSLDR